GRLRHPALGDQRQTAPRTDRADTVQGAGALNGLDYRLIRICDEAVAPVANGAGVTASLRAPDPRRRTRCKSQRAVSGGRNASRMASIARLKVASPPMLRAIPVCSRTAPIIITQRQERIQIR